MSKEANMTTTTKAPAAPTNHPVAHVCDQHPKPGFAACFALRRTDVGHLGVGARADIVMLDAPSHSYLAYRPGVPLVRTLELDDRPG